MKLSWWYLALVLLVALGFAVAPQLVLAAPREPTMGFVQKIFFYHVPVAWLTFLGAFVCAAGSAAFLFGRGALAEKGDRVGLAGAELTVLFGLCMLITGPLWGRKAWGHYWQWDVRLTTALLLWIIFLSYLFARRYGGPGARRLAAGLALFGAADVPLIYFSVSIWRTIHPKATVVSSVMKERGSGLPFAWAMISFTLLFVVLLVTRLSLARAEAGVDALHLLAEDLEDQQGST